MGLATLILWIVLIAGLCIVGVFAVFGLWRKYKAWVYVIAKDYRNPDKGKTRYYAVIDKDDKSIKYFSNLFTPFMTRKVPLVYDPSSFSDDQKRVKLIRSPTGKPGDDMDVPIGLSLNSQAAALDYAKGVSDSVTYLLPFYDKCKQMDLRVGENVVIEVKRKSKNLEKINGMITEINHLGVGFTYQDGVKNEKPIMKTVMLDYDNLPELKSTMKLEDKQKLKPLGYSNFFTDSWVMQRFGIRKVEDANIITIPGKTAIAQFVNGSNEFVKEGQSFVERHIGAILGMMCMVLFGLATIFVFYGANSFYAGITADIGALASSLGVHVPAAAGSTASAGIGTTTTIPLISNNGSVSPVNIGGT